MSQLHGFDCVEGCTGAGPCAHQRRGGRYTPKAVAWGAGRSRPVTRQVHPAADEAVLILLDAAPADDLGTGANRELNLRYQAEARGAAMAEGLRLAQGVLDRLPGARRAIPTAWGHQLLVPVR